MTFTYPHEAHLVKGYLESYGIEIILQDEFTSQLAIYYSSAIGGVKLLIRDSDYQQGIQLLKDGGYLTDEDCQKEDKIEIVLADKTTNKEICPFCSSDNIAINKKPGVFAAVVCALINLIFFIGAIFPFIKSSFKCFDCGKEWKYREK